MEMKKFIPGGFEPNSQFGLRLLYSLAVTKWDVIEERIIYAYIISNNLTGTMHHKTHESVASKR